jgi:1-deoxy-D-xylulose-5-phosphate synthase
MLAQEYRGFVTVEEGTVVNGFGAFLSEVMQTTHPEIRITALGVPDRLIEQAPRAEQLQTFGLTQEGIARRIRTLLSEESLAAR